MGRIAMGRIVRVPILLSISICASCLYCPPCPYSLPTMPVLSISALHVQCIYILQPLARIRIIYRKMRIQAHPKKVDST
jgi:hypothetical protein